MLFQSTSYVSEALVMSISKVVASFNERANRKQSFKERHWKEKPILVTSPPEQSMAWNQSLKISSYSWSCDWFLLYIKFFILTPSYFQPWPKSGNNGFYFSTCLWYLSFTSTLSQIKLIFNILWLSSSCFSLAFFLNLRLLPSSKKHKSFTMFLELNALMLRC